MLKFLKNSEERENYKSMDAVISVVGNFRQKKMNKVDDSYNSFKEFLFFTFILSSFFIANLPT